MVSLLIPAVLFLLACAMLRWSQVARGSAEINLILHEETDLQVALAPTIWVRIGDAVRYLLYLFDLARQAVRSSKKRIRSYQRELFRKRPFFPSFRDWLYQHKRELRERVPVGAGYSPGYKPAVERMHLIGTMQLPRRAYVNDSCIVELALAPELTYSGNRPAELFLVNLSDGSAIVAAKVNELEDKNFEIVLTGVGINVTAIETKVHAEQYVRYSWGCTFPFAGTHTLVLRINMQERDGGIIDNRYFRMVHRVKVVHFANLTGAQFRFATGLAMLISAASGLVGLLKHFGLLGP